MADEDSLMAVIMAQAMNHGNFSMAETGDIPYHLLDATHQQYLRLATLKAANDNVSNFIAQLPIFPFYSFDLDVLYGSVDGQNFKPLIQPSRHDTRENTLAKTKVSSHIHF